jgi:uncharacterized membrane protein
MSEKFGSPQRLVAFSDGVFAVIITILVLELRPPSGHGYGALLTLWPTAVSYAMSYLFVAVVWLNHHYLMRHSPAVSPRLIWSNFAHLFSVSLVPFATSWIAVSRLGNAPVSLYAVIFAATNASYLVLCWEVMDRPKVGDEKLRRLMRLRAWITLALFSAAAAVAIINAYASVAMILFCLLWYTRPEAPSRRDNRPRGSDRETAEE